MEILLQVTGLDNLANFGEWVFSGGHRDYYSLVDEWC